MNGGIIAAWWVASCSQISYVSQDPPLPMPSSGPSMTFILVGPSKYGITFKYAAYISTDVNKGKHMSTMGELGFLQILDNCPQCLVTVPMNCAGKIWGMTWHDRFFGRFCSRTQEFAMDWPWSTRMCFLSQLVVGCPPLRWRWKTNGFSCCGECHMMSYFFCLGYPAHNHISLLRWSMFFFIGYLEYGSGSEVV